MTARAVIAWVITCTFGTGIIMWLTILVMEFAGEHGMFRTQQGDTKGLYIGAADAEVIDIIGCLAEYATGPGLVGFMAFVEAKHATPADRDAVVAGVRGVVEQIGAL